LSNEPSVVAILWSRWSALEVLVDVLAGAGIVEGLSVVHRRLHEERDDAMTVHRHPASINVEAKDVWIGA
jgi:hypothetical protein